MKRIAPLALAAALAGCTISGPISVPGGMATDRAGIVYGQTVHGALEATDARAEDESFYDAWFFSGRAGETVEITLESVEFDAFLVLGRMQGGGEWTQLETNDDAGDQGTDSQIVFTLPEDGEYVIRANSLSAGETGGYTLSLRRR
ncbi:MAG TPA: PPC domain-containing protein [Longimicrobium sp.]|nr:PPC domain-containing protein [Longimicrobium sp.]